MHIFQMLLIPATLLFNDPIALNAGKKQPEKQKGDYVFIEMRGTLSEVRAREKPPRIFIRLETKESALAYPDVFDLSLENNKKLLKKALKLKGQKVVVRAIFGLRWRIGIPSGHRDDKTPGGVSPTSERIIIAVEIRSARK